MTRDVPHVLDYLEKLLPRDGFLFGSPSVADIALACPFRNAAFARYEIDPTRWPVTAAFVSRVLELEGFRSIKPFEEKSIRTPLPQQRAALAEMGAPLTSETYGTDTPRRGLMQI